MVLEPSVAGLFKWRQFEPEMILLAVGWYLRFSLSCRDVEELLAERGLLVDHVTVWRWVQRYAPQIQRRLRPRLRPTNDSWRVDETYIRVKGKWVYLYRALDSSGATIDFLLSAKRDAAAAERFLAKALGGENHPAPRVINTDEHAGYPPAIERLKAEGALEENCRHRPVQYLNNVLEQDHRAIKRRVRVSQHFRSFWGAWRTIAGYEAMQMIRKAKRAGVRQMRRSVYCTNSFSICSLRRANFPIIYSVLWLDYKVATHPSAKELAARTTDFIGQHRFFRSVDGIRHRISASGVSRHCMSSRSTDAEDLARSATPMSPRPTNRTPPPWAANVPQCNLSARSVRQFSKHIDSRKKRLLLRERFLRRTCISKRQRLD